MTMIASDPLAAYNQRIHSLDRRLTKVEAVMTSTAPHLATKADLKEVEGKIAASKNSLLRWIIGVLIALSAFFYNIIDRVEQRSEQRFAELKQLIVLSQTAHRPADSASQ